MRAGNSKNGRGGRLRGIPPQPDPLEPTPEKQADGKGNGQYPLRWNRVKEQQQLMIQSALEEKIEGNGTRGTRLGSGPGDNLRR